MEEIKVDVKIKVGDMYNFFMYHTYSRVSGIMSIIFGLAMFCLLAYSYKEVSRGQSYIYFLFALFFLLFNPINFYARALKQVKSNPTFKDPITYIFGKDGITTQQNRESATVNWNDVQRIVSSGRSIIVYVSKVRASIVPKNAIGDNYEALVEMLQKNLEPSKVKIKVHKV